MQNSGNGLGDALGTIVETAGATNPEQHLWSLASSGHFGHGGNVEAVHLSLCLQFVGPIRTALSGEGPRGAVVFNVVEHGRYGLG